MAEYPKHPRILITGASGSYGRMLTKRCLEKGIDPSTLLLVSRDPTRLSSTVPAEVTLRQGSFDDPLPDLAATFDGADVIFMISTSRAGARLPQHQNAVDAAVRAGAKHIIYTSSIGTELSDPTALVVQEHKTTEEMLRNSGLHWTALRDMMYSDAFTDTVLPVAKELGVLKTNAGKGKIAPVSRDDCVEVAAIILTDPSAHQDKAYRITGPELMDWEDIAKMATREFRKEIAFQPLSDEQMLAHFDALGIPRESGDDLERNGVNGYRFNSTDMVSFGKAMRLGELEVLSEDVERITGKQPRRIEDVLRSGR